MIFEVGPACVHDAGDAWTVRVQVDPSDWREGGQLTFLQEMQRRYVDSMGNSALDTVEVWGDGRLLRTWELHEPPRRTGPEGGDVNVPGYRRGED